MTRLADETSSAKLLAEFKQLFGPPPVLRSESMEAFDQSLIALIEDYRPTSHLKKMHVWDMAYEFWEQRRIKRYKTLLIERRHRQHLEAQAQRRKLAAEIEERKAANARMRAEQAGQAGKATSLVDKISEVEDVVQEEVTDVDEIILKTASERDYARAFEAGIKIYQNFDQIQNSSVARLNNCYDLMERHQRLREQLHREQIVDGEFEPIEPQPKLVPAPPLGSPDEGGK
jgi:hypothetical protein